MSFSSKNKLKLLKRKILFKEWDEFQKPFGKIVVLHDKDVLTRIHPDIGKIHAAVSVNSLSNVQNVEKVIREIGNIMEEDGKLCFVECVNYFVLIFKIEDESKVVDVYYFDHHDKVYKWRP